MRANQLLVDRTKLEGCLPMARALFGEDLENAIETLHINSMSCGNSKAYDDDIGHIQDGHCECFFQT